MNRGFRQGQRAYQNFSKPNMFTGFAKQTQAAHFATINSQL